MKIFARKPENGGIPEIEKKMIIKDNADNLLTLDKPLKVETKKIRGTFFENLEAWLKLS